MKQSSVITRIQDVFHLHNFLSDLSGLVAADVVVDYVIKQSPVITGLEDRITYSEDKFQPLPSRANSLQNSMVIQTYVIFYYIY